MSKKKLSVPSDEFVLAFRVGGTSIIECGFCKRIHYAPGSELDFDKKEMQRLIKNREKNPDKYICHDEDSVSFGQLDGVQYVVDCPCNTARTYEKLIINHRWQIVDYLKSRAEKMERKAKEESKLVKGLSSK